jgi:hypothetical protein
MDRFAPSQPSRLPSLFQRGLTLVVCGLLLLCISRSASAAQVSLAWDAILDPNLAGYVLYYRVHHDLGVWVILCPPRKEGQLMLRYRALPAHTTEV